LKVLKYDEKDMPMKLDKIIHFEKRNQFRINVFGEDSSAIYPLYVSSNRENEELLPLLHPFHRWIGLLRREYSEPPRGLEPHSHPLTEGSKGCGACQATLL
jgi:hypothetical protein